MCILILILDILYNYIIKCNLLLVNAIAILILKWYGHVLALTWMCVCLMVAVGWQWPQYEEIWKQGSTVFITFHICCWLSPLPEHTGFYHLKGATEPWYFSVIEVLQLKPYQSPIHGVVQPWRYLSSSYADNGNKTGLMCRLMLWKIGYFAFNSTDP